MGRLPPSSLAIPFSTALNYVEKMNISYLLDVGWIADFQSRECTVKQYEVVSQILSKSLLKMKTTTVSLTCHSKDYTQDFKDFSILIPENVPSNNYSKIMRSFHKSCQSLCCDCFWKATTVSHTISKIFEIYEKIWFLNSNFQHVNTVLCQHVSWSLRECETHCELSAEPAWARAE